MFLCEFLSTGLMICALFVYGFVIAKAYKGA